MRSLLLILALAPGALRAEDEPPAPKAAEPPLCGGGVTPVYDEEAGAWRCGLMLVPERCWNAPPACEAGRTAPICRRGRWRCLRVDDRVCEGERPKDCAEAALCREGRWSCARGEKPAASLRPPWVRVLPR